ncbi:hypothetical protein [Legionella brunensis]|uniref:Uncharacterized protein n=1 Tax=Legionella brunensis TaxID=29422 RepID=A0A0W0SH99_9GAMM|nr:hypothetical protein [Legionella brunensis]KTC82810.1 hypothetical protein Lbru_1730 [Legionella brunensis]
MIFELRLGMVGLLNAKIDKDQLAILLSKQDDFSLQHDYLHGKIEDQNNFFKRMIQVFYQSWQQKINSKEHINDLEILFSPSYKSFFPTNIPTIQGNQMNRSKENTYN